MNGRWHCVATVEGECRNLHGLPNAHEGHKRGKLEKKITCPCNLSYTSRYLVGKGERNVSGNLDPEAWIRFFDLLFRKFTVA
jgi:hypothetical protein